MKTKGEKMKPKKFNHFSLLFISMIFIATPVFTQGIIVDHKCTDVSKIPDKWVKNAKSQIKLHYAHTSHGGQLIAGIERLANSSLPVYDPRLKYALKESQLPISPDLCIMDGQLNTSYVGSDLYWRNGGESYPRKTLKIYPSINVSMFSWCSELNYYTPEYLNDGYLTIMSELEKEFPQVIFVYMTGNAQLTGELGYTRHMRNEQIRKFCRENKKVLYDFADLDSWYNGEQATFFYNGQEIPVEHPHYRGNECMHTTYESCENKGKAFWWLLARIAGWND